MQGNLGVSGGKKVDLIDMKLMNRLQEGLPLEKDPYHIIAVNLGIGKSEVLLRIKELISAGYIRRLGGAFDPKTMGYTSILIGANVPEAVFQKVVQYINTVKGVTHNYRRSGFLNMWFTLSVKNLEEKELFLKSLQEDFLITDIFEFPNKRNFKLHVFFDMEDK